MIVTYVSLTGNVRNFVERVGIKSVEIDYFNPSIEIDDYFVVIIPSYDDEMTQVICEFIDYKNNASHLLGFVGSGNRNFDDLYCFNAVELSKKYSKPLIFKFEFSGTDYDIMQFKKEVDKIEISRVKQES